MRKLRKEDGGIITINRISSDKVDIVNDASIFNGVYTLGWCFNVTLSEWIKQTEKRLEKLEKLTKADNYEYETKTELVKKSK